LAEAGSGEVCGVGADADQATSTRSPRGGQDEGEAADGLSALARSTELLHPGPPHLPGPQVADREKVRTQ
jgi:hypothetical protein